MWSVGLAMLGLAGGLPAGPSAEPHVVAMDGMQFSPRRLELRAGERVTWINKDLFAHTATAADGGFDSGSIEPAKSWSYLARRPGEYAYRCTLHPGMTGTLVIVE